MILLLGGTSETKALAQIILELNVSLVVSTATDAALDLPESEMLTRITGRLNKSDMLKILKDNNVKIIVDATHPYATEVSKNAHAAAQEFSISCVSFNRPSSTYAEQVILAKTHQEAAKLACENGESVFLTIGSNNIQAYIEEANRMGASLAARVLDCEESLKKCKGINPERIIAGRGPFSTNENIEALRKFDANVLVTKDSGTAGGFAEKLEAAIFCECKFVLIKRPAPPEPNFATPIELQAILKDTLK